CRLNVPSIFIYGGSILPGSFKGRPVTVQDLFAAGGQYSVGKMSAEDLDELEHVACPSAGACGAQFTANTMACVSEAIGLALPYSAGAPAPYEIRDRVCPAAGAGGPQFTANTMACVSEAIGLALPYSAGAPAPYEIRDRFCQAAGEKIMDLIALNIRPRDIVTREALE